MIRSAAPGWRLIGLAAMLSVLGSGIAVLVLGDTPGSQAGNSGRSSPQADTAARGRQYLAGAGSGQASRPVASRAASRAGLDLLQQAVVACQEMPYSGEEVVIWPSQGIPTTTVVDVWHQPGRVTLVRAAAGALPSVAGASAVAGYPDPDGILGVSAQLLPLLTANYRVAYAGQGAAVGRTALVVEVRRPAGSLAARIWLDAATKLPLQRDVFAADARMISEDSFTSLELGSSDLGAMPTPAVAPWTAQLGRTALAAARAQGWPLPGSLPGNLALFAATRMSAGPGPVIGLSYSDGLAVVSLFVQRGELAGPMNGWQPVVLGSRTVYAVDPGDQGDRSLTWSAGGFVYTLVADAPKATISQVVAALPSGAPPGFWHRMARGLHRLASWANPLRR